MNIKKIILIFGLVVGAAIALIVLRLANKSKPIPQISPITPIITISPSPMTYVGNDKYGFTFGYPEAWPLPKEKLISPPQEHVCRYVLYSESHELYVDIYKLMLPEEPAAFAKRYFSKQENTADWIEPAEINNQKAARFFIPKPGTGPAGIAGMVFSGKKYALTIMSSILSGNKDEIVNNGALSILVNNFVWRQ